MLSAIDRESLQLQLPAGQLEQLLARNERQTNRLVAAVIAAAVIQGLAWTARRSTRGS